MNIYKDLAHAGLKVGSVWLSREFSVLKRTVNSLELQVRMQAGKSWGQPGWGWAPGVGGLEKCLGGGSRARTGQILGFARSSAAGCESGCAAADHSFA